MIFYWIICSFGVATPGRLRWEGPYRFQGYKDSKTKKKVVQEDKNKQKWYQVSNQVRRYYPRLDFTTLHLGTIEDIDAQVPTGREIKQPFVEHVYNAPSFHTSKVATKVNAHP
jgi:hypothetical protein